MDDLVDVVDDGRLAIREEQVKMVQFQGEKERIQEGKRVLTALDLMGKVIAEQCQLNLKKIKTGADYRNGRFKSESGE